MQFIYENPWILVVGAIGAILGLYYWLIVLPRNRWQNQMETVQTAPATEVRKTKTTPRPSSGVPAPPPELCRNLQGLIYHRIAEFPWDSGGFMLIDLVPRGDTGADPVSIIYLHLLQASKDQLHRLCGDGGPCYAVNSSIFDPQDTNLVAKARSFFTFLLTTHPGSDIWKTWGVGTPATAWWYVMAFQKAMGQDVTVTEAQLQGSESDTLAASPNFATLLATDTAGNPLTGQFQALPAPKGQTQVLTDGVVPPRTEHRGPTLLDSAHSGATRLLPAVADDGDNNNGSP